MDNLPGKLPPRPSLEHLQKQAKQRVKENPALQLAEAQHQLAVEYGFKNWAELARAVRTMSAPTEPGPAASGGKPPLGPLDPAELPGRLEALIKGGNGGVAAVLIRDGAVRYFQVGPASKDDPTPVGSNTLFDAGSITKVFTALLLAESERVGRVSRSDLAAKYLFPEDAAAQANLSAITLQSLATHTSGLPRVPVDFLQPPVPANIYDAFDDNQLLGSFRAAGAAARPLSDPLYSNLGFAVLGAALARAWGRDYAGLLQEKVLLPLGMTASSFRMKAMAPAGGLKSTAVDLGRFLTFLLSEEPHPLRAALEATLVPQCDYSVTSGAIGLAWMLGRRTPNAPAWHNGATAQGKAFLGFDRRRRTGVALLTSGQRGPDALGVAVLGMKPPQPAVDKVDDPSGFVGAYPFPGMGALPGGQRPFIGVEITEHRGGLQAQINGGAALPLRKIAPDRFGLGGSSMTIAFERDATGQVVALSLTQRGLRGPAQKPPDRLALAPDALEAYRGQYLLAATFVVDVIPDTGDLLLTPAGRPSCRAFAVGPDRFFVATPKIQIHFRRDEAGAVAFLVWQQGGRNMVGAKRA